MKVLVVITCHSHYENVKRTIELLRGAATKKVTFQFILGVFREGVFDEEKPTGISCVLLNRQSYWARSVKTLLQSASLMRSEVILHVSEDLELNPKCISQIIQDLNRGDFDFYFGEVVSSTSRKILFGAVKFKYGIFPRRYDGLHYSKAEAVHGNFFAFKSEHIPLLMRMPTYEHAYLDFHISNLFLGGSFRVLRLIGEVGYTQECEKSRLELFRSHKFNHGRNKISDKFNFYKVKSGASVAIIACAGYMGRAMIRRISKWVRQ